MHYSRKICEICEICEKKENFLNSGHFFFFFKYLYLIFKFTFVFKPPIDQAWEEIFTEVIVHTKYTIMLGMQGLKEQLSSVWSEVKKKKTKTKISAFRVFTFS